MIAVPSSSLVAYFRYKHDDKDVVRLLFILHLTVIKEIFPCFINETSRNNSNQNLHLEGALYLPLRLHIGRVYLSEIVNLEVAFKTEPRNPPNGPNLKTSPRLTGRERNSGGFSFF